MKAPFHITEAEWPIMEALWHKKPATASEIVEEVTRTRPAAMRTIKTLLRRLVAKQLVTYTVDSRDTRIYHYQPAISRDEGLKVQNEFLLKLAYGNDAGKLLSHFVKSVDLSGQEIERLEELLRRKKGETTP